MNISLSIWASKLLRIQEALLKKKSSGAAKDKLHIASADPRRIKFVVRSYVLVEYHKSNFKKGAIQ